MADFVRPAVEPLLPGLDPNVFELIVGDLEICVESGDLEEARELVGSMLVDEGYSPNAAAADRKCAEIFASLGFDGPSSEGDAAADAALDDRFYGTWADQHPDEVEEVKQWEKDSKAATEGHAKLNRPVLKASAGIAVSQTGQRLALLPSTGLLLAVLVFARVCWLQLSRHGDLD